MMHVLAFPLHFSHSSTSLRCIFYSSVLLSVVMSVCFSNSLLVVYLWAWRQILQNGPFYPCTSLALVKGALRYVFLIISHHVPSGSVAAYDISTFHAIFVDVCLSDTELDTFLPDNLGEVACPGTASGLAKRVPWITHFVVPLYKNVVKRKN